MTLVSFYAHWNKSENQRFPDFFRGHRRKSLLWNWVMIEVKLTFAGFSLWAKYYFVIESIDGCYFVNIVAYKTVLMWACLENIYCKCSTNAFVSSMIILTCSKAMDWKNLLGGGYELRYSGGRVISNGG